MTECDQQGPGFNGLYDPRDDRDSCGFGLIAHLDDTPARATVDAILVVHVWHHIAARSCYARNLAAALRPGGKLVIVDFPPDAPKGPPAHLRVSPEQLVGELTRAGLTAHVSPIELPNQYIVEARRSH